MDTAGTFYCRQERPCDFRMEGVHIRHEDASNRTAPQWLCNNTSLDGAGEVTPALSPTCDRSMKTDDALEARQRWKVERAKGVSPAPPPAPHGGHLNAVTDFGAVPDGACTNMTTPCSGTDNSQALQAAIDAAQQQGRALYIPAGRYVITRTLSVGCATPATTCPGCKPTGDAGGCVEPNATEGHWGLHPLIMTGAGRSLTTIVATKSIHALLEFIGPKDGGTLGKSSILHDLRDLAFDAGGGNSCPSCPCRYSETCPQANFSIYAKSITRSDFTRLSFYNAKVAAVSIAYGWINRIRDSLFADNNIGLHAWNQCNNLDITGNSASRVPFD